MPEPTNTESALPKVYLWCNAGNRTDFQMWVAMADDGEVLAQHCSSSEGWGRRDVGPVGFQSRADDYKAKFGGSENGVHFELVYEVAPDDVYALNQARRVEHEAAASPSPEASR